MDPLTLLGLLIVVPTWFAYNRAGLSPCLSLIVLIPLIGPILAVAILAFAAWPKIDGDTRLQYRRLK
jgi:hypothetical protein